MMKSIETCFDCGKDTVMSGYTIRVCNTNQETLFVHPCILECVEYMETSGLFSTSCYKLEVMKVGK